MVSAAVFTGPQTVTCWLAPPVLPVVLVVKVAVLSTCWHPNCGTFTVLAYVKVVGLGSVAETVPRLPPRVSLTVIVSSALVWVNEMLLTVYGAVPACSADPSLSVWSSQVSVAVLSSWPEGSALGEQL